MNANDYQSNFLLQMPTAGYANGVSGSTHIVGIQNPSPHTQQSQYDYIATQSQSRAHDGMAPALAAGYTSASSPGIGHGYNQLVTNPNAVYVSVAPVVTQSRSSDFFVQRREGGDASHMGSMVNLNRPQSMSSATGLVQSFDSFIANQTTSSSPIDLPYTHFPPPMVPQQARVQSVSPVPVSMGVPQPVVQNTGHVTFQSPIVTMPQFDNNGYQNIASRPQISQNILPQDSTLNNNNRENIDFESESSVSYMMRLQAFNSPNKLFVPYPGACLSTALDTGVLSKENFYTGLIG